MYDKKSMTKKAWKEAQKKHRVINGFNTGTRSFKNAKLSTREMEKINFKKVLDSYGY